MIDLRPFEDAVLGIVERHALGPTGAYARYTKRGLDERGQERTFGPNAYGIADAANLLYTLGVFPGESGERDRWIESLRGLQDPSTGLFREATHHEIHTTAHCLGALELFDARPRHPLAALAPFTRPSALEGFLEGLDWAGAPWTESHRGAGLYAALLLAGDVTEEGEGAYFRWLESRVDPATGLLRRGCVDPDPAGPVFPHLAGSFHYLFHFEHARRPWPAPKALIDTCLAIRTDGRFPLARAVWFADVDWVYCLSRAGRLTDHRFGEVRRTLGAFAEEYATYVSSLDPANDVDLDDLHRLFGVVCALAELQRAAPASLRTHRPLRLVLDRRPFI